MFFNSNGLQRSDWELLQNGAVILFWKKEIYDESVQPLKKLRYLIIAVRFNNEEQFCRDISKVLKWNQQLGYFPWNGNLDALIDGFRSQPFDSADVSAVCIENFQKI